MNCLICLKATEKSKFNEYHDKCFRSLFGTIKINPKLPFSRKEFFEERSKAATKKVSISGVQPKLAIKIEENRLETTNEKFTHIIKPSPEDYPQLAENEHLSMLISQLLGIETAQCGLLRFSDDQLVYVTKRFDLVGKVRIHQEDMMQAMGVHPDLFTNAKYEAKSYEDVALFLKQHSSILITKDFFERLFFNFMISNDDFHLKNITIQYNKAFPGGIKLSPHYDAVNTGIYGIPESEMALSLISENNGFTPLFEQFGYHTKGCFKFFSQKIGLNEKVSEKVFNNYLNQFDGILSLVRKSPLSKEAKDKYVHELRERREKFLKSEIKSFLKGHS